MKKGCGEDRHLHARCRSHVVAREPETDPGTAAREIREICPLYIRTSTRRRKGPASRPAGTARAVSAEFEKLLPVLVNGGVDFILIGGVAGVVHGSARATYAVDLVYSLTDEDIKRLVTALGEDRYI